MILIATPQDRLLRRTIATLVASDGPADAAGKREATFQCLDENGSISVETKHPTFADALRQLSLRMDVDARHHGAHITYNLESS